MNRVVITGLGVVSPIGIGKAQFWASINQPAQMQNDRVAVKIIKNFDFFALSAYPEDVRTRQMDRFTQYAVLGGKMAVEDAGLVINPARQDRYGIIYGSAYGCLESNTTYLDGLFVKGPRFVNPIIFQNTVSNTTNGYSAILLGIGGYNTIITAGATSSLNAIAYAYDQIKCDRADAIITGGVERYCETILESLRAGGMLSTSSQPMAQFSEKDRKGVVISEGAAILVLENYEHAQKRGAVIYAEITGYGMINCNDHRRGIRNAMKQALMESRITPAKIDYVCASANSVIEHDRDEFLGIQDLLGEKAVITPVGSIKGKLGETFGASGAFATITASLSLQKEVLPPAINRVYFEPDWCLNIPYQSSLTRKINVALVNSMGLDGNNMSLVLQTVS